MTVLIIRENIAKYIERSLPNSHNIEFEEPMSEKKIAEVLGLDDGITDQARQIMNELNMTDVGEWGRPVIFPANVSESIRKLNESMYRTYGYNALASSLISLNRAIPDNRSDYCKAKTYPKNLPQASIIIPFHDEDWMLLMRTVHSIFLRSPYHLIAEILLVHDISESKHLKEPLEEYIKKYPKIRLIRSHRRNGIVGSRILGARNAVGPILVYLDSHVEVTPGWLEPILARLAEVDKTVVWGKVSTMSPDVS